MYINSIIIVQHVNFGILDIPFLKLYLQRHVILLEQVLAVIREYNVKESYFITIL